MLPKYKEEWIVKIGKEVFILDEKQILILREAMKRNERWVSFKNFIISVPHIECIYLSNRVNENQIEAPKENYQPITQEKWNKLKKQALAKIGKS